MDGLRWTDHHQVRYLCAITRSMEERLQMTTEGVSLSMPTSKSALKSLYIDVSKLGKGREGDKV